MGIPGKKSRAVPWILLALAMQMTGARADSSAAGLSVRFFSAPAWCGPCKVTRAFLDHEGLTGPGAAIPIEEIDIDHSPSLNERTSGAVPELQLLQNGARIRVHVGAITSRADWDSFTALAGSDPQHATYATAPQARPQSQSAAAVSAIAATSLNALNTVISQAASGGPAVAGYALATSAAAPPPPAEMSWAPRAASRAGEGRIELGAIPLKNPEASSAVLLIGTGRAPDENPVSIGLSLREIRNSLRSSLGYSESAVVTLYGYGNESAAQPEAYEADEGATTGRVTRVTGLAPAASFNQSNLLGALKAMKDERIAHALIVLAGHGSREGIPMWRTEGAPEEPTLDPATLKRFVGASEVKTTVLVSGNCYGGAFALAASCGFFAARPDRTASGCSPEAGQRHGIATEAKDYLTLFFRGATGVHPTLADAHWNAVLRTAPSEAPYSSVDALVDRHFGANLSDLPETLSRDEILALRPHATAAEQRAYDLLLAQWLTTSGAAPRISLRQLRNGADTKLLPLIRRLVFRRLASKNEVPAETRDELKRIDACEGQSLTDFLKPKNPGPKKLAGS